MRKIAVLIFLSTFLVANSQNDDILDRLQAIRDNEMTFYNIDGYTITSQIYNYPFTEKGLKKIFRKYAINRRAKKTKDPRLIYTHYYINKDKPITKNLTQNDTYYFIENIRKRVIVVQFSSINKRNNNFERTFINTLMENKISEENFTSMVIDSINFAGRKLKLGNSCKWMNVNNVQCPYYGQINWSVHKDLEDATTTVEQQFEITKSRKGGKVISEGIVDIEFEGTPTKAKKVIYDITGLTSFLVGINGGKTLTIYYVAANVRENYVSCVLSFWNNDKITENGLSPLLEKVMKLKND